MRSHVAGVLLSLACFGSLVGPAYGSAPSIVRVTPRGLQAGAATTLIVEGDALPSDPQLLVKDLPVTKLAVKPGATAKRVELEVTLDPSAVPGIYNVRLAGPEGVSNGEAIGVGNLLELPFGDRIASLPAALTGSIAGSTVMATSFTGHRGDRIVADVVSRRLGSSLQPAVHIYDARGTQLAWSPGIRSLAGDARCEVVLPADGEYRVELHDALYRAADSNHFRLCVGNLDYADFALPLAAQRNSRVALELAGTDLAADKARIEFAAGQFVGGQPAPWPANAEKAFHFSGGRPVVLVSDYAELAENPGANGPNELPAAPVGVTGRLAKSGEADAYRLPVTPGETLRIELFADRLGSPLDGVLTLENEQGGGQGTSDDRPTTKDPGLEFKVPAGMKSLTIKVRDLYGAGGANYLYRLSVEPTTLANVTLGLTDQRVLLPAGGNGLLRVSAKRENYTGPIRLTLEGLPAGVTVSNNEIPASADQALVNLTAAANSAGDSPRASVFSVRGETSGEGPALSRVAALDNSAIYRYQPWLGTQPAAAIVPVPPITLAWTPYTEGAALVPGLPLAADVQVQRGDNVKGQVRVSLITSQLVPKKTVKVPNKPDQMVEAVERSIRLSSDILMPADQSSVKGAITVPGDVALVPYDLALQAELLGADNKTVLASVTTPVRRLPSVVPLTLELTGDAKVEAPAGIGTPGKLTGKLKRAVGFNTPVKIQLTGLPKDVASPSLLLTDATTDFELPVAFRFGTAAGDIKGIKLVALSYPDPKAPDVEARSNELPLELKIVAGTKPTPEQPLVIFEDQEDMLANLNQGGGKAELSSDEKFSGKVGLKVTPDQKSNPTLPGLSAKIRQNPGPGEYRYLQFAWKKTGGQMIAIQLAHDGKFGPVDGMPAKYRYSAGPAAQPFGGTLSLDNKIPNGFTLVTRDLFADFGEFTLTGLSFAAVDGSNAVFDHISVGRDPVDFDLNKP